MQGNMDDSVPVSFARQHPTARVAVTGFVGVAAEGQSDRHARLGERQVMADRLGLLTLARQD